MTEQDRIFVNEKLAQFTRRKHELDLVGLASLAHEYLVNIILMQSKLDADRLYRSSKGLFYGNPQGRVWA